MARKSTDPVEKLAAKIADSAQVSGRKTFVTFRNASGGQYTEALEVNSFPETIDRIKNVLRELPQPIIEMLMQEHRIRPTVPA